MILENLEIGEKVRLKYQDGDDSVCRVVELRQKGLVLQVEAVFGYGRSEYEVGDLRYIKYVPSTPGRSVTKVNSNNEKVMSTVSELTSGVKRLLSPSLRTLYKAGFIDGNLSLTCKGKDMLFSVLVEKFNDELVKEANEVIAEEEAAK